MTRRRNLPLLLFAVFTLFLGSCVPLTPAPSANPTSPSPSLWVTVSPEQVIRNEAILATAKPLIEKANRTYLIPGWIHFEIRTEVTAPLPEGSSVPEEWRDETWSLLDENGEATQTVEFHDTGNTKTSYITTFQDGSWRNLTNGAGAEFQGNTHPVPLDSNFLEGAEYYINAVELGYDEMDTMDNERMAVFTMPDPKPADDNSGQANQLTQAKFTKFYFSITSGLLMKIEEYTISPTGPVQTVQRITTLVENVEQPPAEVLKYLTYAPMTPVSESYPNPPTPVEFTATPEFFPVPTLGADEFDPVKALSQIPIEQGEVSKQAISDYLAVQHNTGLSDEEKIKAAIDAYFTIQYEGQKLVQVQDFSALIEDDTLGWVKKEKDKRDIELYIAFLFDMPYQSYKFILDYDSIEVNGNEATIQLKRSDQVVFKAIAPDVSEMSGLAHTFILHKRDGVWVIYLNEYKDELSQSLDFTPKETMLRQVYINYKNNP